MIDRLEMASRLAQGKRVLDIGGVGMGGDKKSVGVPFAGDGYVRGLRSVEQNASAYRTVDIDPRANDVIDLSSETGPSQLGAVINQFKPELIVCMETLEHLCNASEVLRVMGTTGCEIWITLPNNRNPLLDWLGWNYDHCFRFCPDTATRFVQRVLPGRTVRAYDCFQKYLWYWPLAYAAGGFRGMNVGLQVMPRA
jgi:hypothetical protein